MPYFRIPGETENAISNCEDCSISVPKSEIHGDEFNSIDDEILMAKKNGGQFGFEIPFTKEGNKYEMLIMKGTAIPWLIGMVYRYGGKIFIEIEDENTYILHIKYKHEDMNARLNEYNDQILTLEQSGNPETTKPLERIRDKIKNKLKGNI